MGWPTAYYYPEEGGPLEVLSFDRVLSDRYMTPLRDRTDARGGDGRVSSLLGRGGARVTIRRERFTTASFERKLRNWEDHLIRGGRTGFSWDHAKTWASYGTGALSRGGTISYSAGNAFRAWNGSATLVAGDEIVIESPNPEMKREVNTVSALNSSGDITLGTAAHNTYTLRPMTRYRWFWPALFLPEDQLGKSIVTSDRGLNFSLSMELEVDPRIYTVGLTGNIGSVGSVGTTIPDLGLANTATIYTQRGGLPSLDAILDATDGLGDRSYITKPGPRVNWRTRVS